jgi:hypothetical protein
MGFATDFYRQLKVSRVIGRKDFTQAALLKLLTPFQDSRSE